MRTAVVSVDFGDLLELTLPYNRHHWSEVMVVTHPSDVKTIDVAVRNSARVFLTEAFYRDGAKFNKFLALEEGLEWFGRRGLMALVDADVFWPRKLPLRHDQFRQKFLYSFMRRRLLLDVTGEVPPEDEWESLPLDTQDPAVHSECMGYTQIFHADDPVLASTPWHRTDLTHAAMGDSLFQRKWDLSRKFWMDGCVLHLGEYAKNWCGRVTRYRDGTMPKAAESNLKNNDDLIKNLWPDTDSGGERK